MEKKKKLYKVEKKKIDMCLETYAHLIGLSAPVKTNRKNPEKEMCASFPKSLFGPMIEGDN